MFGVEPDARGYDRAAEWITVVERAYAATEPFDHEGEFYSLRGVVSSPASLQRPRPATMNAAFGAPGRDFAARHCDFLFSTFTDIPDGRRHLADIRDRATAAGREIGAYTVAHVVCRDSQAEAEDYYDRYARDEADTAAVDAHMAGKRQFSGSHDARAYAEYRQRFAGGAGTYPLIGTPDRIAETLAAIASEGWEGLALSFVNYTDELPHFCRTVLPRLSDAGLRAT
jgi:alkanesulfonate monooxygenase SsuD/methylene tetrahydromethanopterin reductase-like flavin-dependent oxidoreductase (luciferase family)